MSYYDMSLFHEENRYANRILNQLPMEIIETYGVIDTHIFNDPELAVMCVTTGRTIEECSQALRESKGFMVINFIGKGVPGILRACEAGLQVLDDGTFRVTHVAGVSSVNDPDQMYQIIENIELSVDIETWLGNMIRYKLVTDNRAALNYLLKVCTISKHLYRGDLVIGRKFREPEAEFYPLENLL